MTQTARKETGNVREKAVDEEIARALGKVVRDACHVYRYRDLEGNLREFGWRKARRRVLGHGALSGEWAGRGRSEVRLTRRGLEVRLAGKTRRLGWPELQDFVRAQRY